MMETGDVVESAAVKDANLAKKTEQNECKHKDEAQSAEKTATTAIAIESGPKKTEPAVKEETTSQDEKDDDDEKSLPRYQYPKEKLIELRESPMSQARPPCYETLELLGIKLQATNGSWDDPAPFHGGKEKKLGSDQSRLERDTFKRRPSDPKVRIREEEDGFGVVLSPQRRSFGKGCHVNVAQQRTVTIDTDRDRDNRREQRRIGSGRLQLSSQHESREFAPQGKWHGRGGDEPRYDRTSGFAEPISREFSSRRGAGRRREPKHELAEEPEWFTSGPASQSDTIELRGFDETGDAKQTELPPPHTTSTLTAENGHDNVAKKNSSLETNESSSAESCEETQPTSSVPSSATNVNFDFNVFLDADGIPGINEGSTAAAERTASASRFSQWFPSGQTPHDSRRSSLNDEFNYLNELVSGQKSPVVPSPTIPSPIDTMTSQQKDRYLMQLVQETRKTPDSIAASTVENDLKAMLLTGSTLSTSLYRPMPSIPGGDSKKILTIEEVERSALPQNAGVKMWQQKQSQQKPAKPQQDGGDMGAFNKLLQQMKISGELAESPKMPKKVDGRPISPINLARQQQEQKNAIAHHQQQAKLQQLKQQQLVQQQQQQFAQLQQLQQQQQQQRQIEEQIVQFVKQNAGLLQGSRTAIVSPLPPPQMTLQPSHSPMMRTANLLQQPASPRAMSPVMFGSQPPMHAQMPSPVHPMPMHASPQALSPNTLQVGAQQGAGQQWMPSAHELIVHTKAIMQNALIKKLLVDQKDKFQRKQQERARSPNRTLVSESDTLPSSSHHMAACNPSFTPTSVIRRMASEKAEEKERLARQNLSPSPANNQANSLQGNAKMQRPLDPCNLQRQMKTMPPTGTNPALSAMPWQIPPPNVSPTPAMPGLPTANNMWQGSQSPVAAAAAANKQMRPLVGQGMMNSTVQIANLQSRPIVKGQHVASSRQQQQRPIVGSGVEMCDDLPGAGPYSNRVLPMGANASSLIMQSIMNRSGQLNPLTAMQQQMTDASPQQPAVYPGFNRLSPVPPSAANANPQQQWRPISPQQQHFQQMVHNSRHDHPPTNAMSNNAASRLLNTPAGVAPPGGGANLSRWFGADVLGHPMPGMPPSQNQRVLTLDEIECQPVPN